MGPARMNPDLKLLRQLTKEEYVLAARIQGKAAGDNAADKNAADKKTADKTAAKSGELNVVLVADIDCLYPVFFALRERGDDESDEIDFDLGDNVTFVLNVLDSLAGEDRFIDVRNRRPEHRTLTKLTEATKRARDEADSARLRFSDEYKDAIADAQKKFEAQIEALKQRKNLNQKQALTEVLQAQTYGQRELEVTRARLKDKRDAEVKLIESKLEQDVHGVQDWYKLWAVLAPPIPPLLVGLAVYFSRRAGEREGVARSRLRG